MTMRMVFHNKSSKKFPLYSDYNPNSCNHGLPGPVTSPLHLLFPVHEISSSAPSYDGSIPSLRALLQIYLFREVFQVYLFKRELIPLLSYSFFFTTLTVWNGTKMFFMSFFPPFFGRPVEYGIPWPGSDLSLSSDLCMMQLPQLLPGWGLNLHPGSAEMLPIL